MIPEEDWLSPLLDAEAMRSADAWAIEERDIPSLELMETAGRAVGDAVSGLLAERSGPGGPVRIVCGKGNNGGDGLVAARRLLELGHGVDVLLLWPADELSDDAKANLRQLPEAPREIAGAEAAGALAGSGAVVDAIFGTGFSSAPREPAAAAIEAINACGAPVVACDIASGIDASDGTAAGVAVEADLTISFHAAKVGHRISPGARHTGELRVVDIGIPAEAPTGPAAGVIEFGVLKALPRRAAASTKFSSGNVLVVGASRGLTGAVAMASSAAIRAGAGYAAAAVPAALEPILEVKLTEVMTLGVADRDGGLIPDAAEAIRGRAESADCVVLGPGAGRQDGTRELLRDLAGSLERPLLIDADGLNALGTDLGLLRGPEREVVLTPHAGELGRLLGCTSSEVDAARLESARSAARDAGAIVVLKGADSIITDGDRVAVNAFGSPALATAGTGDVLSGTVAALIARGVEPFKAACAGVYAHARAGRLAAERIGVVESVVATDVVDALPGGLRVPGMEGEAG